MFQREVISKYLSSLILKDRKMQKRSLIKCSAKFPLLLTVQIWKSQNENR